jgi:putative transposase
MGISLFKYMVKIITKFYRVDCKLSLSRTVNGFKDHVQIFFELNPSSSVSYILDVVMANSSRWINELRIFSGKFQWQKGYGAFTYSRSQRNSVIQYIINQNDHHNGKTFREEYMQLLKVFEIEYNPDYLFEFYD